MWVLIDNYDSFTYILHHYLLQTGNECVVIRNDAIDIAGLEALNPSRIIISPGPQTPKEAGISLALIEHFQDSIPILGICLGHQALGVYFGATLQKSPAPMHGKTSIVEHNDHPLFAGIPRQFEVMRYHSLCIDLSGNKDLQPIAFAQDDQVLMAFAHQSLPLIGLQFHPESIGTTYGQQIIGNWAKMNF